MAYNIDIGIADDHILFKQAIETMFKLTPGLNLIMQANNGADLLNLLKKKQPDVILLDLRMPILDGLSTLPLLKSHYPDIKVIVLTLVEDDLTMHTALKLGAVTYLTKNSDPDVIIRAIKQSKEPALYE